MSVLFCSCLLSLRSRLLAATAEQHVHEGFLQYLSPTLQFLLAVFVYGETFDRAHAVAFVFIWTAVAIFAAHSARTRRQVLA